MSTQTQTPLFIKITLDSFTFYINRTTKLLTELTDEQLTQEVAPGRNSGIYLLGHLVAVHDAMLPLLRVGERQHPELEEVFIKNPDKSGLQKPAAKDLREYWQAINAVMVSQLQALTPEQWFERHNSVSEEDFLKEPHRNRLNIISSRTSHLAYHLGQMAFLKR